MKLVIDIPYQIKACLNNENEWTALLLAEVKDIVNNGVPLEQEPKDDFDASWNIVEKIKPKAGGAWHVCKQFDLQEQKTDILDKIRAEITVMDFDFGDYYDHTDETIEKILQVIDKYRQEGI